MKPKTFLIRQVIGENIRTGRRKLNLTQEQFAESSQLSVQFLSAIENGTQFARMDTYFRISEALKLPFHTLFYKRQFGEDALIGQYHILLWDCDANEKNGLLQIMNEIKAFRRM